MKKSVMIVSIAMTAAVLSGCQQQPSTSESNFTKKTTVGLIKKAKTYPLTAYQKGSIPAHTYVKLRGRVTKTDADTREIKKGDRFILTNDGVRVQVFNQSSGTIHLNQRVTVYGEYYGFIQGDAIQAE